MSVSGIHELYFSKNTSGASHVSWEDYDYEYKSEVSTRCGRHPPIVERPIPRVKNMTEFYNPTRPSHFINGALVRKRRVYVPHELRSARRVVGTMGINKGPAYLTRSRSGPVRRSRSYSRSPSKTLESRRSYSNSPSRSPVRCPIIRSCTRSRSASYTRSRYGSPSYSRSSPKHEAYIAWKRQFAQVPGYQKDFLRNVVFRLKGMSNLDKFFEGCEIPPYVWRNAQEDSKIEPAEMAEYSAIEQAVCIWWFSNNKPLYWKIEHLQAGFEKLNIGKFFRSMLERHPQMHPSFHDIQLDLPETDQVAPSSNSPAPCNITVEYAERQISKRERNFLQYLSRLVCRSEFVDKLAHATSLDTAASCLLFKQYIMTLNSRMDHPGVYCIPYFDYVVCKCIKHSNWKIM